MIDLLLFFIGAVGWTHLLVEGAIFDPLRAWLQRHGWRRLLQGLGCYQCSGFWAGAITALCLAWAGRDPLGQGLRLTLLPALLVYGAAASWAATEAAAFTAWLYRPAPRAPEE